RGVHHADRDRRTVAPLVALCVLDGVAERVSVVEDLALPRLAEVFRDDCRLHLDREFYRATELLSGRVDSAGGIGLDDVEDLRSPDESCLDDLGVACGRLIGAEAAELIEIADDGTRCPERADEVLALCRVHARLTAD